MADEPADLDETEDEDAEEAVGGALSRLDRDRSPVVLILRHDEYLGI